MYDNDIGRAQCRLEHHGYEKVYRKASAKSRLSFKKC